MSKSKVTRGSKAEETPSSPEPTATSSGKSESSSTPRHRPERSPLGAFAQLPQEVREIIYAVTCADGSVALTRASKAFHESTKRSLYQHGVYRINIEPTMIRWGWGYAGSELHRLEVRSDIQKIIPDEFIANVQNLQIRVTSFEDDSLIYTIDDVCAAYRNVRCKMIMDRLAEAMDKTKHCHVQLNRDALTDFKNHCIEGLKSLKTFESITIEIIDEHERKWLRYIDAPQKKNGVELSKITALLRLKEGEKGPRLSILRHPPKDSSLPLEPGDGSPYG